MQPTQSSRREMQRMATELEIKAAARAQLAADGIQHVTLRGIARALGMTAPALYRYFPSLDDLVASMSKDFFTELTEAITQAIEQAPADPGHRMHAAIRAFRDWAVGHPGEFALMIDNGSPSAPGPAGGVIERIAAVFFTLFVRLWRAQPFPVPEPVSTAADARLVSFAERCLTSPSLRDDPSPAPLPAGALVVFARTWVRLYGVISMDVSGQLSFLSDDVTPYFESELADAATALGIAYVPQDAA